MPNNIAEFRSVLFDYDGLANPNSFRLRLPAIPVMANAQFQDQGVVPMEVNRSMEFMCNTADLPGLAWATQNVTRYGYGASEKKPWFPLFNDVMLTFLNDSGSNVLQYFQQWFASISNYQFSGTINSGAPTPMYEFAYKKDYAVDAELTLFDNHGIAVYALVFRDFFPLMIPETKLAWETTNQVMQVVVMFTFTDFYFRTPEGMTQPPGAQFGQT